MTMTPVAITQLHTNVINVEENDDGTFTCYDSNWDVVTLTSDEVTAAETKGTQLLNDRKLKSLRKARNKRLADTDYWGASDTPTMSQAQIDYRQALRDITNTYTSLSDVVWPTKP